MTKKTQTKMLPDRYRVGFLASMDARTDIGRRLSYSFNRVCDDLGGIENLPHTKVCLVERFAWLQEYLRQIEYKLGDDATKQNELLGRWFHGVNTMSGLARSIGVNDPTKKDFIDTTLYAEDEQSEQDKT